MSDSIWKRINDWLEEHGFEAQPDWVVELSKGIDEEVDSILDEQRAQDSEIKADMQRMLMLAAKRLGVPDEPHQHWEANFTAALEACYPAYSMTIDDFIDRMIADLASAAKGLNEDKYYDLAMQCQLMIQTMVKFSDEFDSGTWGENTWQDLRTWTAPEEED